MSCRSSIGITRRTFGALLGQLQPAFAQHGCPPSSSRPRPSSGTSHRRPHSTFSSVNPEEISHFNALAESWWDPYGSSRALHLMNPLRHDFIRTCRASEPDSSPSTALRYLDIGCGGGIFAESAARLSTTASVTAVDPSPEVLAVARRHAKKDPSLSGKLTYLNTAIEALPVPTEPHDQYDIVSLFEVVEHVSAPGEFIDRCAPFVKPGGWLVGSTIARTWMSWFVTNLMAEDVLRIVPKGTHDWNKYINEPELRSYLLSKGWESPVCVGVVFVPGFGWREVKGSEQIGNYFFGVRKALPS